MSFSFCQVETPKDVQEKFGRTVVEKYLLWDLQLTPLGMYLLSFGWSLMFGFRLVVCFLLYNWNIFTMLGKNKEVKNTLSFHQFY